MNNELLLNTRESRINKFKKIVASSLDYDKELKLGSVIVYPLLGDITYPNNYRSYVSPPFNKVRKIIKVKWNHKIYNIRQVDKKYRLMHSSGLVDENAMSKFRCTNRFSLCFILCHEIASRLTDSYRVKVNDSSFQPLFSNDRFNSSDPEIIINITDFKTDIENTDKILNISIF
jgi:hypothetical protein